MKHKFLAKAMFYISRPPACSRLSCVFSTSDRVWQKSIQLAKNAQNLAHGYFSLG